MRRGKTVFRAGFGMFVGPGQTEDQIQPIESDRISSTLSKRRRSRSTRPRWSPTSSTTRTTARTSRAPTRNDYTIPGARLSVHRVGAAGARRAAWPATAAYVGSQGRNLFLRSVANQITQVVTNPNPANARVRRSASSRSSSATPPATSPACRTRSPRSTTRPAAATTATTRCMLSLTRRSASGLSMNVAVHAGQAATATPAGRTRRSPRPTTRATLDDFDYDNGYNNFDVRHTFNLSVLYSIPYGQGRKYGATPASPRRCSAAGTSAASSTRAAACRSTC